MTSTASGATERPPSGLTSTEVPARNEPGPPRTGGKTADSAEERSEPSNTIRVRYFAGARGAVGLSEETVAMPAGATVRDLVAELGGKHGEKLTRVLTACSFLLDGVAVRDLSTALPDGAGVDVLPPFAGG